MKLKLSGRAALLACASLAIILGLSSCASSTLGYLFATSAQYGQVVSLRLDINTGAIKSVTCNKGNGDQQNCVGGAGGTNPTKLILANSNTLLYVMNAAGNGSTGGVTLMTVGNAGTIYSTGQSYSSSGQNPLDMYIAAGYLLVLDQFQPAPPMGTNAACATPTVSTCPGDITVFSIDSKGDLNLVQNTQGQQTLSYFPLNYVPNPVAPGDPGNHIVATTGFVYVLDQGTPGVPEVNSFILGSNGQLQNPGVTPTQNPQFVSLSSIVQGSSNIYISDFVTGQVWAYTPAGNGSLSASGTGVVCPAVLAGSTSCTQNPISNNLNSPVALSALQVDQSGQYLYAADYNNQTVFSMKATPGTGQPLTPTSNGGATTLGTQVTCMTLSTGTEFLYLAGNGNVAGEQIDTSTGNLSTNAHETTTAPFSGTVPCIVFSSRT